MHHARSLTRLRSASHIPSPTISLSLLARSLSSISSAAASAPIPLPPPGENVDPATLGNITLHGMLEKSVSAHADRPLFGVRRGGQFEWQSYGAFGREVEAARGLLGSMGAAKNTAVAVISSNRPEWAAGAYAAFGLGGQYVPMYEQQAPREWGFIVGDSGARIVLVSKRSLVEKVKAHLPASVQHVLCLEDVVAAGGFAAFAQKAAVAPLASQEKDYNSVACIIYTSGTTGKPKGVELTHRNIMANVEGSALLLAGHYSKEDVHVSFLPWAHIYGQSVELHGAIAAGAALACAEGPQTLLEDMPLARPTVLVAVPQLFYRVHDGIHAQLKNKKPYERRIFSWALGVARRRGQALDKGSVGPLLGLQWSLAQRLVFSKIYARFGGRLRHATTGGAALAAEVKQFFCDIGIPIIEGYGLTETSPVLAAERYGLTPRQMGGMRAQPGVRLVVLDESGHVLPAGAEGEVAGAGPTIMRGYHGNAAATAEVMINVQGHAFFRTGDLGVIDEHGALRITGRLKEQYKLQNGKYCVPSPLETVMKLSPYVLDACVYGDNRPYNIALVVPDVAKIAAQLNADPAAVLSQHPQRVRDLLLLDAQRLCTDKGVKAYERIRDIVVLPEPFTLENNMLTPKQSVRRRNVFQKYMPLIEAAYAAAPADTAKH